MSSLTPAPATRAVSPKSVLQTLGHWLTGAGLAELPTHVQRDLDRQRQIGRAHV